MRKNIAVIGCGVAGLFSLKAFIQHGQPGTTLSIFEASETMGVGMPYSPLWAGPEHKANILCQEFPEMLEPPHIWLARQSDTFLAEQGIARDEISESFIFPRITLGHYMQAQFSLLLEAAEQKGLKVNLYPKHMIADIRDLPGDDKVRIQIHDGLELEFEHAVVTTGHVWPVKRENAVPGYYDSPFPLRKLSGIFNHHVGLMGSSLTAVDAIKTLSRRHGHFEPAGSNGSLKYIPNSGTENFKISMHSRRGLLPGIRFHTESPLIDKYLHISRLEIDHNIAANGFLSLDYVFDKAYMQVIAKKDPELHAAIQGMNLEEFVEYVYVQVRSNDPFKLFRSQLEAARAAEAAKSPIHWKEALEGLFYTLNFHAKHLSGEDMLRLRTQMMPLLSYISACLPFDSCEELIALHEAGKLKIIEVGYEASVSTNSSQPGATFNYTNQEGATINAHYDVFIECVGQRAQPFQAFPFKTLLAQGAVSPARVKFAQAANAKELHHLPSGCGIEYEQDTAYLRVPGLAINDDFAAISTDGKPNPRLSIMTFAHIQGFNPDVPGIPCCSDIAEMVFRAVNDNEAPSMPAHTRELSF